jgi:hypothetical protein
MLKILINAPTWGIWKKNPSTGKDQRPTKSANGQVGAPLESHEDMPKGKKRSPKLFNCPMKQIRQGDGGETWKST